MVQNSKSGDPYAYAFLKVIYNELNFSNFSCLVGDMLDLCTIINSYPSIEQFLSNPIYDSNKKKQFLNTFFGQYLNSLVINFLNLLCDTKRIVYISSILKLFLEILLRNTNSSVIEIQLPMIDFCKININRLDIILSTWFSNKKTKKLTQDKNFILFKEPLLIYTIKQKPELLGGFKLNFLTESKIIDFSISTKIQKILKVLEY
jgi:F0F1-type ATP synthase delta subunit